MVDVIRITRKRPKRARFCGLFNSAKTRVILILANDRLKGGKGLTRRQLYEAGANLNYSSLGTLLKRYSEWYGLVSRRPVYIKGHEGYRYKLTRRGLRWLMNNSTKMLVSERIDEIKNNREIIKQRNGL